MFRVKKESFELMLFEGAQRARIPARIDIKVLPVGSISLTPRLQAHSFPPSFTHSTACPWPAITWLGSISYSSVDRLFAGVSGFSASFSAALPRLYRIKNFYLFYCTNFAISVEETDSIFSNINLLCPER